METILRSQHSLKYVSLLQYQNDNIFFYKLTTLSLYCKL